MAQVTLSMYTYETVLVVRLKKIGFAGIRELDGAHVFPFSMTEFVFESAATSGVRYMAANVNKAGEARSLFCWA